VQRTEPFVTVTRTDANKPKSAHGGFTWHSNVGKGAGGAISTAAAAPPAQMRGPTGPVGRRRNFPATAILASTAAPEPDAPPLNYTAVGFCDRLATVVVQQLATRSWAHARQARRATNPRRLTSRDVLDTVRAGGTFDLLHHANVLGSGLADEPAEPAGGEQAQAMQE
jgi:hypothetical protein